MSALHKEIEFGNDLCVHLAAAVTGKIDVCGKM